MHLKDTNTFTGHNFNYFPCASVLQQALETAKPIIALQTPVTTWKQTNATSDYWKFKRIAERTLLLVKKK